MAGDNAGSLHLPKGSIEEVAIRYGWPGLLGGQVSFNRLTSESFRDSPQITCILTVRIDCDCQIHNFFGSAESSRSFLLNQLSHV